MKKRSLVAGLALVMALSMSMLTGCGSSKEDYIHDAKELVENIMTPKDMDMKTSEGKQLKEDYQDAIENPEDADLEKLEKDSKDFEEAARDAGVEDDDLADLAGLN